MAILTLKTIHQLWKTYYNDIIVWLNFSLTYLRFTINVCSCICIYICMYIHIHVSSFEFSIRNVQLYRKYHNPSFISSVQPSNLETVLFDNRWSIDILLSPLSGKIRNLEVVKIASNSNQPKRTFLIIAPLTTSSPSRDSIHFLLQRYCSRGRRYFPQKSTNLTCSTLLLKNTPVTRRINFLFFF